MPTDDERRDVAARLREIRLCKSGHIEWWKIAQALGLKEPAGWFGWEKFEPDSVKRLADLIDQDCGTQEADISSVHEHSADTSKMVDRDALLRLARYMDKDVAETEAHFSNVVSTKSVSDYARRIREACGAADRENGRH